MRAEVFEKRYGVEGQDDLRAITAGAPLPVHPLPVRPEENVAVQQRVPVARLETVIQGASEGGRRHRTLVSDGHALRKAETFSSLTSQDRRPLGLRHAGQAKEALSAEQAMLEDRRDVVGVREMIKAIELTHRATKPIPAS